MLLAFDLRSNASLLNALGVWCFADSAKTGIGNRALKPTLGIIDPINMETMPKQVAIASGFDVLCHSLESYTAIPFDQRTPRPLNPNVRPAYQGSNPISDVWCQQSLKVCTANRPQPIDTTIDSILFKFYIFAGLSICLVCE